MGDVPTCDSNTIEQFAKTVIEFTSQYGSEDSNAYTAVNILGKPSIYPKYGDCDQAFVPRTYGNWWRDAPSADEKFGCQVHAFQCDDFIEVEFENEVYPESIHVFETYNPGSVVKLFAFSKKAYCWILLWSGNPQPVEECSRVFSPPIRKIAVPTNRIRLEFCHMYLKYYMEVDAVLLIGKPGHFSLPLTNIVQHMGNLSIRDSCILNDQVQTINDPFNHLPDEIIRLIVGYLDIMTLCHVSRVSRLLRRICYDPFFYAHLNLKPFWHKVTSKTLLGFIGTRSSLLTKLDLSWCGKHGSIRPSVFIQFVNRSCYRLTCLRLSGCHFFTDVAMRTVVDKCVDLQELNLQSCVQSSLTQTGFKLVASLKQLRKINLYRTRIKDEAILEIVRGCTLLEHINLGSCIFITNMNAVTDTMALCLTNLKSVDLWRSRSLHPSNVIQLFKSCKLLQELDVGWCLRMTSAANFLKEIAEHGSQIRKLFLTAIRNTSDEDLLCLGTNCKRLQQLDILGTRNVTVTGIRNFLSVCTNLKFLDVSFCPNIGIESVVALRQEFRHVQIKKSSQEFHDVVL